MARTNNLTNFLTDVATSIKAKTGDSTAIPASQFDTKIANISTGHLDNTEYAEANDDVDDILENTVVPSGTISITANGEYDVTNYIGANVNVSSDYFKKEINQGTSSRPGIASSIKHISNDMTIGTTLYASFLYCTSLLDFPLLDTSNVTNMERAFYYCSSLTSIPLIDTSKVTTMLNAFYGCSSLTSIPLFNTGALLNMNYMFGSCSNLTTVPIFDTSKVTSMTNTFANCTRLSNDSLNNILKMCINATAYAGTKTLATVGLSSAQATICQGLSNYSDFIAAGWTTGY